jgi:ketosteroid isomerase-like protein
MNDEDKKRTQGCWYSDTRLVNRWIQKSRDVAVPLRLDRNAARYPELLCPWRPPMPDSTFIAKASYEAYARKDRAAIESLIAPDFHFTSPLDNRIDRQTYFERCWPNSERISGFEFIHVVPHGEQVFVTYEAVGADGKKFRNTEILTVRNGQIVEAEVYFGWSLPHAAAAGGFTST